VDLRVDEKEHQSDLRMNTLGKNPALSNLVTVFKWLFSA
jgi:hypothetical protein